MRTYEGDALEFVRLAVLDRFAAVAFLRSEHGVVEHCWHRDVVASSEADGFRINRVAVAVGESLEVAAHDFVEGVFYDLCVYVVLKQVPSSASGVEAGAELGRYVGVIEDLSVGFWA